MKQPGAKRQFFVQVFGQFFGPDFGQTEQQKQQRGRKRQRDARASRAGPLVDAVTAVVSVFMFDQILEQKIDLGWPGSKPALAQVKRWAGPGSCPRKIG